jgi:hypothetical protein
MANACEIFKQMGYQIIDEGTQCSFSFTALEVANLFFDSSQAIKNDIGIITKWICTYGREVAPCNDPGTRNNHVLSKLRGHSEWKEILLSYCKNRRQPTHGHTTLKVSGPSRG